MPITQWHALRSRHFLSHFPLVQKALKFTTVSVYCTFDVVHQNLECKDYATNDFYYDRIPYSTCTFVSVCLCLCLCLLWSYVNILPKLYPHSNKVAVFSTFLFLFPLYTSTFAHICKYQLIKHENWRLLSLKIQFLQIRYSTLLDFWTEF